MPGNQWKLPLNLALGFHLMVGFSIIFLPDLIDTKPRYEDIYTVSLINMADPAPSEPAPAPAETIAPTTEPVSEKTVSIANNPPEPVAAPPKAISIKPSKRKKKLKIKPKVDKPANDALKRRELAEMIKAQQEAEEQARILAEEAALERKIREKARNNTVASQKSSTQQQSRTQSSGSSNLSTIEKQYYAALTARLQALWELT